MSWFYAVDKERKGPVDKSEIERLAKEGVISKKTLVWREGMADWTPLGELTRKKRTPAAPAGPDPSGAGEIQSQPIRKKPESSPPPSSSPPSRPPGGGLALKSKKEAGASDQVPAVTANCRECGRNFPEDDTILLNGVRICAECKPLVLQKMKEGSRPGGQMVFGGFWRRFCAKFIDGVLMTIINGIFVGGAVALLFGNPDLMAGDDGGGAFMLIQMVNFLLGTLVPLAYSTWFLGKYGATLGKMALGLRVVSSEGHSISYQRALGRSIMEWISGIILCIGYLMAAFDEEKRTLHDRACDTRVIRTR